MIIEYFIFLASVINFLIIDSIINKNYRKYKKLKNWHFFSMLMVFLSLILMLYKYATLTI